MTEIPTLYIGRCTQVVLWEAEHTDTFGGEANYCWVRRARFYVPRSLTQRGISRRGKAALGLTGARTKTHWYGDEARLDLAGLCQVVFLTYVDE